MRARREFLKTLGLGFLAAISDTRVSAGSSMGEPPAERHWTWTRVKAGETPDDLRRRVWGHDHAVAVASTNV